VEEIQVEEIQKGEGEIEQTVLCLRSRATNGANYFLVYDQ
jgi:hypothetical protein